jgi:hypothetical protein
VIPAATMAEHEAQQGTVAERLEAAWSCRLVPFSKLSAVDYYVERDDRMRALVEVKCRNQASTEFGTALLSVRKWLALTLAEVALGVPALYVYAFTDCLLWAPLGAVDVSAHRILGRRDARSDLRSDREPMVVVPVNVFREIGR